MDTIEIFKPYNKENIILNISDKMQDIQRSEEALQETLGLLTADIKAIKKKSSDVTQLLGSKTIVSTPLVRWGSKFNIISANVEFYEYFNSFSTISNFDIKVLFREIYQNINCITYSKYYRNEEYDFIHSTSITNSVLKEYETVIYPIDEDVEINCINTRLQQDRPFYIEGTCNTLLTKDLNIHRVTVRQGDLNVIRERLSQMGKNLRDIVEGDLPIITDNLETELTFLGGIRKRVKFVFLRTKHTLLPKIFMVEQLIPN